MLIYQKTQNNNNKSWSLQLAESNEACLDEENAFYTYKVN